MSTRRFPNRDKMPPIALEKAKALGLGTMLYSRFHTNKDGTPLRAKVSGRPKTWKRDPSRVEVPIKHGLYTYGYLTQATLDHWSLNNGEEA